MKAFISRRVLLVQATKLHRILLWIAALALVSYVVSGVSHPIMTWTGPQAEQMRPPQLMASKEAWKVNQPALVAHAENTSLQQALLVQTHAGPAFRTFQRQQVSYILAGEIQHAEFEQQHAEWLARYYLGSQVAGVDVAAVQRIDSFSRAYPSVNRLLPVWRIDFATADNLHAYVHTETMSLASVGNSRKSQLQNVFQLLHTHSYLDAWPRLRFFIELILITSLLFAALSGVGLIFAMPKRKRIASVSRRWHRNLAIVVFIPLLALAGSGAYHLIDKQGRAEHTGPMVENVVLSELGNFTPDWDWYDSEMPIQQLSVVINQQHDYLLRVQGGQAIPVADREQRFAGRPAFSSAHYVDAHGVVAYSDQQRAKELLSAFGLGEPNNLSLVTRFGGLYDFRNKRLPVWRADYADATWFVDAARGVIVEEVAASSYPARWVFQQLHKWNFLTPWFGRNGRDIILVTVLVGFLSMLAFGLRMRLRRRR